MARSATGVRPATPVVTTGARCYDDQILILIVDVAHPREVYKAL
jgi:hypothetical protein